jgi:tetratricopeptide (TPR) repeat protein
MRDGTVPAGRRVDLAPPTWGHFCLLWLRAWRRWNLGAVLLFCAAVLVVWPLTSFSDRSQEASRDGSIYLILIGLLAVAQAWSWFVARSVWEGVRSLRGDVTWTDESVTIDSPIWKADLHIGWVERVVVQPHALALVVGAGGQMLCLPTNAFTSDAQRLDFIAVAESLRSRRDQWPAVTDLFARFTAQDDEGIIERAPTLLRSLEDHNSPDWERAEVEFLLAQSLERRHHHTEVIDPVMRVLASGVRWPPDRWVSVWALAAEANANVGRLSDASAAIQTALDLIEDRAGPRHLALVLCTRGRVSMMQGRVDEGFADLEEAREAAVSAGQVFLRQLIVLLLGWGHLERDEPESTIELLSKLQDELEPGHLDIGDLRLSTEISLAVAHLAMGNTDLAEACLATAASLAPEASSCAFAGLRLQQATLHRQRGHLDEARPLAEKALSLFRANGLAWELALAHLERAREEVADRNRVAADQHYDAAADLAASFPNPGMSDLIATERPAG